MKIHRAPKSSHVAADVLYRRFMRVHFRGIVFNLIAAEPFLRETSVGFAITRELVVLPSRFTANAITP